MKDAVKTILIIYSSMMLPVAEAESYGDNWGAKFVKENAEKSAKRIAGMKVNVTGLTNTEAELLGFPLWDEETGIRLIPLWLYTHLADGQKLVDINGTETTVGPNYRVQGEAGYIDNDHRGGALAYGFVPSAPSEGG